MIENFKKLLKKYGLKATPARLGVLGVLVDNNRPLDIKELQKALKLKRIKADQVTIYRVVEIFVKKEILKQVDFKEGRLRYEFNDRHHHHLVCNSCGTVRPVYGDKLDNFEKKIGQQYKFLVKEHTLEFFGVCGRCQDREAYV
jgi:Fur family ferric uptake transcriptional regulator